MFPSPFHTPHRQVCFLLAVAIAATHPCTATAREHNSQASKPGTPPAVTQRPVDRPPFTPRLWPSQPPAGCPLEKSTAIPAVGFTGRHAEYETADTWYPSWASDGNLYSPFTDGVAGGLLVCSWGEKPSTGQAKIIGDDPLHLQITDVATYPGNPAPYGGRYPCGSLVHNGVWYYGTYCLMNEGGSLQPMVKVGDQDINWGVLGPFVGFRVSKDLGKTWTDTPHTPKNPIFPEPQKMGDKVKIGSPHFVDFGKNMEHSPDGKAYLVAHGALDPDPQPRPANASWISGDQVFLLRVIPSPETINDASKYEFFAGHDKQGNPLWTHDFTKIKPLVDWNNHLGCVTMTYNAPLKKYLMCAVDGWPTAAKMSTSILEADSLTGPWRLVTYMKNFGSQAYFVNFPSKFISPDGRTAWLCYSANFTNAWMGGKDFVDPPGSGYKMCLQEVRLLAPTDPQKPGPLAVGDNIARYAMINVSSTAPGTLASGLVDGVVEGYPSDASREWASQGESNTAMLRLTWREPQRIDRVWIFGRLYPNARISSGMLIFSDGSTIKVGALPDASKQGLEVRFPARTVNWLIFAVTGAPQGASDVGLSEIAVFRAAASQEKSRPIPVNH